MKVYAIIILFSVLFIASLYDIKYYRIRHIIHPILMITSVAFNLFNLDISSRFIGLLICIIPMLIIYFIKGGVGMGDVYLCSAFCFCLGASAGLIAVILGYLIMIIYYYLFKYKKNKKSLSQKVPMCPFLSIGFLISVILNWRYL